MFESVTEKERARSVRLVSLEVLRNNYALFGHCTLVKSEHHSVEAIPWEIERHWIRGLRPAIALQEGSLHPNLFQEDCSIPRAVFLALP